MLELAVVKTTPQSSEAPSQRDKKPPHRADGDDSAQEFQSEYEAATKESGQEADDIADAKKPAGAKDTDAEASSGRDTSSEKATLSKVENEETEFTSDLDLKGDENSDPLMGVSSAVARRSPDEKSGTAGNDLQVRSSTRFSDGRETKAQRIETSGTANVQEAQGTVAGSAKPDVRNNTTAETIVLSKAAEHASKAAPVEGSGRTLTTEATPSGRVETNVAAAQVGKAAPVLGIVKPNIVSASEQVRSEVRDSEKPLRMGMQTEPSEIMTAKKNSIGVQATPAISLNPIGKIDVIKEKADLASVVIDELDGLSPSESRSAGQTTSTSMAQVLQRSETPSMIARQMAEALQRLPDRPVEISLNPRELGRVRMSISAAEAGITVSVIAERPETLDLMRRNIDQLMREFQSIGYDTINFAFSEGEAQQSFGENPSDTSKHVSSQLDLSTEEQVETTKTSTTVTTGVDIRL